MLKTFFTFLLIFVLSYYLIKSVFRLLGLFSSKNQSEESQGYTRKSKKSKVTFDDVEPQKKRFGKDSGEYVDFEEIK